MTLYPKIPLSRLREIGWKLRDPIGLARNRGSPDEGGVDEYDRYLLHAASMISRGGSKDEAAAYLTGKRLSTWGCLLWMPTPQRQQPKR